MNWFAKFSIGLAVVIGTLSPGCKQAVRLQSESRDRTLSLCERFGLRFHLLVCKWCRRYGTQLKFLRSEAHQFEEHAPAKLPHELSPESRERIKQRLQPAQRDRV